jgi:small subunit ribosomal protein S12
LLSNAKKTFVYIPGIGHDLQKFSTVLVRGGRANDLPGVKYRMIRGKHDLLPIIGRLTSRSKYGTKRPW